MLFAQEQCNCSVSGKVVDRETGIPLYGAIVRIPELEVGVSINKEGKYHLKNLCPCPSSCTIEISHVGYGTLSEHITLGVKGEHHFYLEENNLLLNEVTVSDQKVSEGISTTVQTLSDEALERERGKNLGDALKSITGVSTLQTGVNVSKPVIHGLHSNRVLTLYNGVRLEGQQWGADHGPEIDPFVASSLSVVKGAASVKYGSDALGGVIIVNPPELMDKTTLKGELYILGMSNGRAGVTSSTLQGGQKLGKGTLGWRVQGTARKSGDKKTPNYSLTNTGAQELNFSGALGFHQKKWGLEAFFSRYDTELGILRATSSSSLEELQEALDAERPDPVLDFTYRIGAPRQEVKHDLLNIKSHYDFKLGSLSLIYGFQTNQRQEFDVRRSSLRDFPSLDLTITTSTLDLEWEHHLFKKDHGNFGINYLSQENRNIPGTQSQSFIPNFNQSSFGAYAIQHFHYEHWSLEAGFRFDRKRYDISGRDVINRVFRNTLDYTNITGTIGASWDIGGQSSLTTNIGTAWRPPNLAELYSFGLNQGVAAVEYGLALDNFGLPTKNVDNLKNEQALKWTNTFLSRKDRLVLEGTAYINWIANYIFLRPESISIGQRGEYVAYWYRQTNAFFAGVDLAATYDLVKNWSLETKASYISVRDAKNKDRFLYMPNNTLEVALSYHKEKWKGLEDLHAKIGLNYNDRQRNGPERVIFPRELERLSISGGNPFEEDLRTFDIQDVPDAYALLNLEMGMAKSWGEHRLDIKLEVFNVANAVYREYTNRLRYYADDMGRNITLGLKYSF